MRFCALSITVTARTWWWEGGSSACEGALVWLMHDSGILDDLIQMETRLGASLLEPETNRLQFEATLVGF